MIQDDKSIRGHIEWLARRTGAPRSFIDQVHALFRTKGISLDAEASPYLPALEEAFRREEAIRNTAGRARQSVIELQQQFSRLGQAYRRQLDQLRRIRSSLASSSQQMRRVAERKNPARPAASSSARSNGKVVVTRPVSDDGWMVPGPEELQ